MIAEDGVYGAVGSLLLLIAFIFYFHEDLPNMVRYGFSSEAYLQLFLADLRLILLTFIAGLVMLYGYAKHLGQE